MRRLEGKRTLVTGAASPMGREVVLSFVENGATVLAVDATDEKTEAAIEALGLADSDDVTTRGLDETDLGSWWDLANLVAAFYDELDVFVHISQIEPAKSLALAIDRLAQSLRNADQTNPGGVSVVVVSSSDEKSVTSIACELASEGARIGVSALAPGSPNDIAASVLKAVSTQRSAS